MSPEIPTALRRARIAAAIEQIACRFTRHHERRAVRAYLLRIVSDAPDGSIRLQLSWRRGDLDNLIAKGRRLVRGAVCSGKITHAEMLRWLKDPSTNLDAIGHG